MLFSHESEHIKNHDLTNHELMSFLQVIASMGRSEQIPRWPWFFKQLSFHSVPSFAGFIRLILLRSLPLYFPCATLAQCWALALEKFKSSRVKKVLMLCKLRVATSHFFFSCEMKISMELARSCCGPKQRLLLRSIFPSVISLWAKIWHRNKTACSKLNLVQSSKSKSTTCPGNGRLLRFESNSAATSDGCTQKLGNDVRSDSELIATKVCSEIGSKWNVMFESHVVTIVDRTSLDFWFEDFLRNLPL